MAGRPRVLWTRLAVARAGASAGLQRPSWSHRGTEGCICGPGEAPTYPGIPRRTAHQFGSPYSTHNRAHSEGRHGRARAMRRSRELPRPFTSARHPRQSPPPAVLYIAPGGWCNVDGMDVVEASSEGHKCARHALAGRMLRLCISKELALSQETKQRRLSRASLWKARW